MCGAVVRSETSPVGPALPSLAVLDFTFQHFSSYSLTRQIGGINFECPADKRLSDMSCARRRIRGWEVPALGISARAPPPLGCAGDVATVYAYRSTTSAAIPELGLAARAFDAGLHSAVVRRCPYHVCFSRVTPSTGSLVTPSVHERPDQAPLSQRASEQDPH